MKNPKIIVTVEQVDDGFETLYAYDCRKHELLTKEYIKERGIEKFDSVNDIKETLNWNLNGNFDLFELTWAENVYGTAYVYD